MSDDVLEQYVRQYIHAAAGGDVLFTWHGGEPMLRPLSFYQRAVELQRRHAAPGQHIDNALQTNGTLITRQWAEFLAAEGWLVGISIDGPRDMHDKYRHTRPFATPAHDTATATPAHSTATPVHSTATPAHPTPQACTQSSVPQPITPDAPPSAQTGQALPCAGVAVQQAGVAVQQAGVAVGCASHELVEQGVQMLRQCGVEWNAMAVVTRETVRRPLDFYRYFRDHLGCRYLQFTPETECGESRVTAREYGDFLCAVFDEWSRRDVGRMFVQMFDSTLAGWVGVMPGVCSMAPVCGHAAALEWNGDLYACDHFVDAAHRLGNIMESPIGQLMAQPAQRRFGMMKREGLSTACRRCQWLRLCNGGCPKDRDATGRNVLCEGLSHYFAHTAPLYMRMAALLAEGREAAEIMKR